MPTIKLEKRVADNIIKHINKNSDFYNKIEKCSKYGTPVKIKGDYDQLSNLLFFHTVQITKERLEKMSRENIKKYKLDNKLKYSEDSYDYYLNALEQWPEKELPDKYKERFLELTEKNLSEYYNI